MSASGRTEFLPDGVEPDEIVVAEDGSEVGLVKDGKSCELWVDGERIGDVWGSGKAWHPSGGSYSRPSRKAAIEAVMEQYRRKLEVVAEWEAVGFTRSEALKFGVQTGRVGNPRPDADDARLWVESGLPIETAPSLYLLSFYEGRTIPEIAAAYAKVADKDDLRHLRDRVRDELSQ